MDKATMNSLGKLLTFVLHGLCFDVQVSVLRFHPLCFNRLGNSLLSHLLTETTPQNGL